MAKILFINSLKQYEGYIAKKFSNKTCGECALKFTEERLEQAIIELLGAEGYPHVSGQDITREPTEVLIKEDLRSFLAQQYAGDNITTV